MDALVIIFTIFTVSQSLASARSLQVVEAPEPQICSGENFLPPRGNISSPGYPHPLYERITCVWTIRGRIGHLITVIFNDVDMGEDDKSRCTRISGPCCVRNWIQIGPPGDPNPRIVCGTDYHARPYVSHAYELIVSFSADGMARGRGFHLTYTVGPPVSTEGCGPEEFACRNGRRCIPKTWRCNGRYECADSSDEIGCPKKGQCPGNGTSCGSSNGECYDRLTQRCDRVIQCSNGVDEIGCVPECTEKIMCSIGGVCYSPEERCNGNAQCTDHSDEKGCCSDLCHSQRGAFLCANGRCIPEKWRCDQTNDCGDNTDETDCIKNSVITAAVMGSLICGLLLVIAIGCTCKLYALRYSDSPFTDSASTLPMARLAIQEQEFLRREPPPPYSIAIASAPPTGFFSQRDAANINPSSLPAQPNLLGGEHFRYQPRPCRNSSRRTRRTRRHRTPPAPPPPRPLTEYERTLLQPQFLPQYGQGPFVPQQPQQPLPRMVRKFFFPFGAPETVARVHGVQGNSRAGETEQREEAIAVVEGDGRVEGVFEEDDEPLLDAGTSNAGQS